MTNKPIPNTFGNVQEVNKIFDKLYSQQKSLYEKEIESLKLSKELSYYCNIYGIATTDNFLTYYVDGNLPDWFRSLLIDCCKSAMAQWNFNHPE